MTRAEIGIILLGVANLILFVGITVYIAQTDRELYELRRRVTMLEIQHGGDGDGQI